MGSQEIIRLASDDWEAADPEKLRFLVSAVEGTLGRSPAMAEMQ